MYKIKIRSHGIIPVCVFFSSFIVFGAIGVFLLWSFGSEARVQMADMDSKTVATGYTTDCSIDSDGDNVCYPIYTFEVDGNEYSCKSNISSATEAPSDYKVIYYDSVSPSNCLSEYNYETSKIPWYVYLTPIGFILIGLIPDIIFLRRILRVKKLEKVGTLYRGLDYEMVDAHFNYDDHELFKIKVNFTMPNGETIELYGNPRLDGKTMDEDGKVDLLIDLDHPKRHYLDFNIEER